MMGAEQVSFEEYVDAHGQSLLRLAYVLTGDGHLAEDLTQISLADAYRHWSKVSAARSPDAYVRRMLVNAHLSWRRRRSSTEQPSDLTQVAAGRTQDTSEALAARDEMRQILTRLAPRARTVLVLRYYADHDDATIAELMGISEGAVRATASRAIASLRNDSVRDATEETR
jgi:RNA polymerase sigma-70 factor (sigma-E family)